MRSANLILSLIAIIGFVGMSFTNPTEGEAVAYKVDTKASVLNWKAYKVTGQHNGTVNIKSGELMYDNGNLTGGNFVIDMTSITVLDLKGNNKQKLEGHLKSPDFFSVEEHPTAKFEIKLAINQGPAKGKDGALMDDKTRYKVEGDLTIKGITKPIKFNAIVSNDTAKKMATADVELDRSEFDVRYGSGSFFENLGDKTIYDNFDISIELVAME